MKDISYSKKIIENIFYINDKDCTTKVRRETFLNTMKPFIPYCLIKMNEEDYLPVNRFYKPLGMPRGHHYKYEDFDFLFLKKEEIDITPLWDNGKNFGHEAFYFYSDACTPHVDFQRYIYILDASLFTRKSSKKFKDFWKYKFNLDKEGWKRNEWKL